MTQLYFRKQRFSLTLRICPFSYEVDVQLAPTSWGWGSHPKQRPSQTTTDLRKIQLERNTTKFKQISKN